MLTVITGCMFSGKTSALIARAEMNIIAGKNVILIKPSNDTRFGTENVIHTHSGQSFPCYIVDKDKPHKEILDIVYNRLKTKVDVIIIDEAQFFSREIFNSIADYMTWAHVIVGGLKEDSNGKPFGMMPELLCAADDIIHLKAICIKCTTINSATRTYRKAENKDQVFVGGKDSYEPRCLECWI